MVAENSHSHAPQTKRGYLIPIGGAEERTAHGQILERFVALAGGKKARIVIVPAASSFAVEVGTMYCDIFSEMHAADVLVADIRSRTQANDDAMVAAFHNATGIFFAGGDQVKLVAMLGATKVLEVIKARYSDGATIAGTSAGASALSEHMIAFGRSGSVPTQRMVAMAPGLGFIDGVTIDQHFRERDRVGRLMAALAHNPSQIGVGVDENTALVINPDGEGEVVGVGSVVVIDARGLEYTDVHSVKRYGPVGILGMKVHILTQGFRYNLVTNVAIPAPDLSPTES